MKMDKEYSVKHKSEPENSLNMPKCEFLSTEMRQTLGDYKLSLHGISENSKEAYVALVKIFGLALVNRKIRRFEDVKAKDIDLFLSKCHKDSTKNNNVIRLKHFYGTFLKLPDLVEHLKLINNDLKPVTLWEIL